MSYLKEAANCPLEVNINGRRKIMHGKMSAEHVLGHFYQEGIYVEKDIDEAMRWYEKAVEHKSLDSAHNLAGIYFKRCEDETIEDEIAQNLQRAERLYLLSYKFRNTQVIPVIVSVYNWQKNHEKMLLWHERGLAKGCMGSLMRDDQVRRILEVGPLPG